MPTATFWVRCLRRDLRLRQHEVGHVVVELGVAHEVVEVHADPLLGRLVAVLTGAHGVGHVHPECVPEEIEPVRVPVIDPQGLGVLVLEQIPKAVVGRAALGSEELLGVRVEGHLALLLDTGDLAKLSGAELATSPPGDVAGLLLADGVGGVGRGFRAQHVVCQGDSLGFLGVTRVAQPGAAIPLLDRESKNFLQFALSGEIYSV